MINFGASNSTTSVDLAGVDASDVDDGKKNDPITATSISLPQNSLEKSSMKLKSIPIALSWKNLEVSVRLPGSKNGCCGGGGAGEDKKILQGVSGIVKPGTLLAIIGASGAGKTTLLNLLTARNFSNLNVSGHIYANGFEIGSGIKNVSAYVQQDDLFIGTLTVREQLQFRALLRMDRHLSNLQRLERVEDVIVEMGLNNCCDSRIGNVFGSSRGISGGERKRLSFASEALTDPPVMFCDEPTSGLDSFMAQNIVNTLQAMASKGHTILCTIHQPSSELFAMFNQILILSEGRTAFSGSSHDALDFFARMNYPCPNNFNPADHYILTLAIRPGSEEESKRKLKAICDSFSSSEAATTIMQDIDEQVKSAMTITNDPLLREVAAGESRYATSVMTQLRYLFWRSWITQFRDVILFRIRFAQSIFIALIFGLIYLQLTIDQKGVMTMNGAIFILIISTSFSNMFAVINSFPIELAIFMREYGNGLYSTGAYFITKTVSETPLFLMVSVIFISIAYWMIGLYPLFTTFLWAQVVFFLTAMCGISLGYFISAACGSVTASLAIAPGLLIPFMLFGGLFINSSQIPVYFVWLKYLSWFRYANEILMVNQWTHIDHIPCNENSTAPVGNVTAMPVPEGNRCQYRNGDDVLEYTSFDKDNVYLDTGVLCTLLVGFRLLAFIALYLRAKRSRE